MLNQRLFFIINTFFRVWQNLLILTKLPNTKGIYTKNEDYRHLTDPANLVQTLVSKHLLHPILPHVFQIQVINANNFRLSKEEADIP